MLQGDNEKAKRFLLGAAKQSDHDDASSDEEGGPSYNISSLIPRGKFSVFIDKAKGVVKLKNKTNKVKLSSDMGKFVGVFLHEKSKRYLLISLVNCDGADRLNPLLCEKPNNKRQALNCICIEYDDSFLNDFLSVLSLSENCVPHIGNEESISSHYKMNMGRLTLVPHFGVVFFKPPLVLHKDTIEKYEWLGGSNRFINLLLNDKIEFGSIGREAVKKISVFLKNLASQDEISDDVSKEATKTSCEKESSRTKVENTRSKRKAAEVARGETKLDLDQLSDNDDVTSSSDEFSDNEQSSSSDDESCSSESKNIENELNDEDSVKSESTVSIDEHKPAPKKVKVNVDKSAVQKKNSSKEKDESSSTVRQKSAKNNYFSIFKAN